MIVAGGTYLEVCLSPSHTRLLGSGGRAFRALQNLNPSIELYTFHKSPALLKAALGSRVHVFPSAQSIEFFYRHPLARPDISHWPTTRLADVKISAEMALSFGCVEGDFVIEADVLVYDPQSAPSYPEVLPRGSRANRIAFVLNEIDAKRLTGKDDVLEAGQTLHRSCSASATVVKHGPFGAFVWDGSDNPKHIPAYLTQKVNKIGSGDVFSATFAYHWGERALGAVEAAARASAHTAEYVETNVLPCPLEPKGREPIPLRSGQANRFLLIADLDTAIGRWLGYDARSALTDLGAKVFIVSVSNLDSVSNIDGFDAAFVAVPSPKDNMLQRLLQTHLPIVVYVNDEKALEVLTIKGVTFESDFASSVYRTFWGR